MIIDKWGQNPQQPNDEKHHCLHINMEKLWDVDCMTKYAYVCQGNVYNVYRPQTKSMIAVHACCFGRLSGAPGSPRFLFCYVSVT